MAVAKKQQKRLGKGLSALLGDYMPEDAASRGDVEQVATKELRPNPYQPRQAMFACLAHRLILLETRAALKGSCFLQQPILAQEEES